MYAKQVFTQGFNVLAACNKELIGKEFIEGEIHFNAKEYFYKGEIVSEKKLAELLREADSINLFGDKPVSVALKEKLLSEKSIKKIQGIPHAQIIKL
ncbi:MAG TPA: DUF424 family protein [archaeon]|nr:DUF424 family protein [archaeon]